MFKVYFDEPLECEFDEDEEHEHIDYMCFIIDTTGGLITKNDLLSFCLKYVAFRKTMEDMV